jgi:hypothetical protein
MDMVNKWEEPSISKDFKGNAKNRGRVVGSTTNSIQPTKRDAGDTLATAGMTFKVIPGQGGIAIETSSYDTMHDRYNSNLHIVPEGAELSEALAHIISMESLRR